ncbi:hypothetical protein [Thermicanus aegyptius]|nr:hypothetical protein [Thermicanus aegyptius]
MPQDLGPYGGAISALNLGRRLFSGNGMITKKGDTAAENTEEPIQL